MPSPPAKTKILLLLAKTCEKLQLNFLSNVLFYAKTRASLK